MNGRRSHRYWSSLSSDSSTHFCVRSAFCAADRVNSFLKEGGGGREFPHRRRRLHAFFTISSDESCIMSKFQCRYSIVQYESFIVVWRPSHLWHFHGVYIMHYGFDLVEWTFFIVQSVQIRSAANFFYVFLATPFAVFFLYPSASRIEYILGRRLMNSFIILPSNSSFIFPQ